MNKLNAIDPSTLPELLLESILVLGVRLTAPAMCRPGHSTDDAAQLINPYLNVLPHSCIPQVSLAVILQCPWIDANVASLSNNLWLLDTLAHKLSKAPYWRPMQFDDTLLLDKVSAKGFVDVLEWWKKSKFVIKHEKPLQVASDNGHVAVLQWWLDSGLLGKDFPDYRQDSFNLLEPTRKGDKQVLNWWLRNVLQEEMDSNDSCGGAGQLDGSRYLNETFADAIWVAIQAKHMDLVDWWIEVCTHYCGISDAVMSMLFASGDESLVEDFIDEYLDSRDHLSKVLPYIAFSGDIGFLDYCWKLLEPHSRFQDDLKTVSASASMGIYASCAGHVHVLDFLQSKGWISTQAFDPKTKDLCIVSAVWRLLPQNTYHHKSTGCGYISHVSLLDVLADNGLIRVLEWWTAHYKPILVDALKSPERVKRFVDLALANGHVAVLDWILSLDVDLNMDGHLDSAATAAFRGHLASVQWYLKQANSEADRVPRHALQEVIRSAMLGENFEICEWLLGSFYNETLSDAFGIVYSVLEVTPRGSQVVEWSWKNASRLPFKHFSDVSYKLFDQDPIREFPSRHLNSQDLWGFLCMNGATATMPDGKEVTFAVSISDMDGDVYDDSEDDDSLDNYEEEETIELFRAWKGYPLFLEQLLTLKCPLSQKAVLNLPLNLEFADISSAGVSVLNWLYSLEKRGIKRFNWTSSNRQRPLEPCAWASLEWWEQMGLGRFPFC